MNNVRRLGMGTRRIPTPLHMTEGRFTSVHCYEDVDAGGNIIPNSPGKVSIQIDREISMSRWQLENVMHMAPTTIAFWHDSDEDNRIVLSHETVLIDGEWQRFSSERQAFRAFIDRIGDDLGFSIGQSWHTTF